MLLQGSLVSAGLHDFSRAQLLNQIRLQNHEQMNLAPSLGHDMRRLRAFVAGAGEGNYDGDYP
jgi:hypothetical protein